MLVRCWQQNFPQISLAQSMPSPQRDITHHSWDVGLEENAFYKCFFWLFLLAVSEFFLKTLKLCETLAFPPEKKREETSLPYLQMGKEFGKDQ